LFHTRNLSLKEDTTPSTTNNLASTPVHFSAFHMNPSFLPPPWMRPIQAQPTIFPVPITDPRFGKREFPPDFAPDNTSVMCGRGKACTNSQGNKRLKAIVKDHISRYANAKNKAEKTVVVNMIMNAVQGEDKRKGLFVRQHAGRTWWEVEDTVAREKVGCMIRDALHTKYRSSSRAKFLKKRKAQTALRNSDDDSTRDPKPPSSSTNSDKDYFQPNPFLQDASANSAPMMPSSLWIEAQTALNNNDDDSTREPKPPSSSTNSDKDHFQPNPLLQDAGANSGPMMPSSLWELAPMIMPSSLWIDDNLPDDLSGIFDD
jgi:hypothetical protein